MDKPEWMPVNPCDVCPVSADVTNKKCRVCTGRLNYENNVIVQKKLLEYLIARPTLMNLTQETVIRVIYISEFESMLKQLEENK
jgi:hypothetical protein